MLISGLISLLSGIILMFSISKIRHRMPNYLKLSDRVLIKLCWLIFARLMIVALYSIPVAVGIMDAQDYYFKYFFNAYTYGDLLTSIIALGFSYFLYINYYKYERAY